MTEIAGERDHPAWAALRKIALLPLDEILRAPAVAMEALNWHDVPEPPTGYRYVNNGDANIEGDIAAPSGPDIEPIPTTASPGDEELTERDKMDCDFILAQGHYLFTAEIKWPYINSATAIKQVGERLVARLRSLADAKAELKKIYTDFWARSERLSKQNEALRARIAELEELVARKDSEILGQQLDYHEGTQALRTRIAELEGALRPFDDLDGTGDDDFAAYHLLKLGDLRRVGRVLHPEGQRK